MTADESVHVVVRPSDRHGGGGRKEGDPSNRWVPRATAPREWRLTCHGRVAEAFALPRERYIRTVLPQVMDDHDHLPGAFELSISELSLSVVIKTSIGRARATGSEAKHRHGPEDQRTSTED